MRCVTGLLAFLCLLCAALPMALIAVAIWLCDGRPIFFCQTRVGQGMRPFSLFKFRTMRTGRSGDRTITVGADSRITPLGRLLRRYRLDELPQIFNILRGDMNFIGPRPEIPEFVDATNPMQLELSQVRPGLFDSATLHWLDEADVLESVPDWKLYYRQVVLPDKCARSLADVRTHSVRHDLGLAFQAFALVLRISPCPDRTLSRNASAYDRPQGAISQG